MPRLTRSSRLSTVTRWLAAVLPLAAVAALQSGCTCGSGPYEGDYFDGDRPNSMKNIKFVESEKGDPAVIGCADGQREGFADLKKNPRIAGCVGSWKGQKSLQAKSSGNPCGDDGSECAVPADVCAVGWHVCGSVNMAKDLTEHTSVKECHNAGPGRFNAAISHSPSEEVNPCPKITPSTQLKCVSAGLGSEAVCCGNDCKYGKCKDAVWKGKTQISRGTSEGCGAVTSKTNAGVMCCYDGEGNPEASGKTAPTPAADGGAADGAAKADGGAAAEGGEKADGADGEAKAEGADGEAKADGAAPADAKGEGDKKAEGDAKAEGGDAKKAEGDAKKAEGDAKKEEKAG